MSVVIIIIVIRNVAYLKDPPSLKYTLDLYDNPITTINRCKDNEYAEEYVNALKSSNKELIDWKESNYIGKMIKEVRMSLM